jgi:hypothetical protein
MIIHPPVIAAADNGEFRGGGRSWSMMATMKMVRRAATEERTGDVRLIRTRNDPEKTASLG